jgi:hypothetical protein
MTMIARQKDGRLIKRGNIFAPVQALYSQYRTTFCPYFMAQKGKSVAPQV